jgi:hypothetical protein
MIDAMSLDIAAGAFGLGGALIGGGFTLGAQRAGDRDAQAQAVWTDHQKCVAALRLTLMDLDRSLQRLDRDEDPRGFIELPRGAWLQYRTLLAPHLNEEVLQTLVIAYNEVIEWNEILWGAFAGAAAPESFHGSDQYPLDRDTAAAMLAERRPHLERSVAHATAALAEVHAREACRTEAEVRPVPMFAIHRAERRRLGAGQPMVNIPSRGTDSVPNRL